MIAPEIDPNVYRKKIRETRNNFRAVDMVDAPSSFLRDKAYLPQIDAIRRIGYGHQVVLSSHTGSGKTAVFLTQTQSTPAVVIECRNDLQQMVYEKYLEKPIHPRNRSAIIKGKEKYTCYYAENASLGPCALRYENSETRQHEFLVTIMVNGEERTEIVKFPCDGCAYYAARDNADRVASDGGTIVCNHGNYHRYLPRAKLAIIDEAEYFFVLVSNPTRMRYVNMLCDTPIETLTEENKITAARIKLEKDKISCIQTHREEREVIKTLNNLALHATKLETLISVNDLCYQYKTKRRSEHVEDYRFYVKLKPNETTALKNRLFGSALSRDDGFRLILVSATPGCYTDIPQENIITYSIPRRVRIFYSPVANMSYSNTKEHPEDLKKGAMFVQAIHKIMKEEDNDSEKCVIHCSSLQYVDTISEHLGKDLCTIHLRGKLPDALRNFEKNDTEYLLLASGDRGTDFPFTHQFIFKVPHKSPIEHSDELRELKKVMGDVEYEKWSKTDTLNTIVQQAGRVGRGANGFGCTWIIDQSFHRLYYQYKHMCPKDFCDKIDMATHKRLQQVEQFEI